MNSKSRYFSSLLIALVAALGYYMLTDFNIKDIQLKTFSSLGIPFRMYQINNSVKQKKLPLPKVVYSYAIQQDKLIAPHIELIASNDSDAAEFLAGLTGALLDAEKSKLRERNSKQTINDISNYGSKNNNIECTPEPEVPPQIVGNPNTVNSGKDFKVDKKVTPEDIEMFVSTVATQNVKKIEECFKKIKVIYGEDNSLRNNVIVSGTTSRSTQTRGSVVNSCTTVTKTRTMIKATPVAETEDDEEAEEMDDSEN